MARSCAGPPLGLVAVSYTKDVGEVSARYRPGGEVPSVTYPSGTHVVFTAPGSATSGQYGLFEWNMTGTRGGADPHFHKTFSESFYVMEGTVRLFNGETWIDAVKGDFLYVPQGGIHAFSNESGAPARMLILFAPGPPREEYFSELAEIRSAGRKLTRRGLDRGVGSPRPVPGLTAVSPNDAGGSPSSASSRRPGRRRSRRWWGCSGRPRSGFGRSWPPRTAGSAWRRRYSRS